MSNNSKSSGTSSSPQKKTFTSPTTMSSVLFSSTFSDAGTESSAPNNHPQGPSVTRANTEAGDAPHHAEQLVFQHIGAKLRGLSVSTTQTALTDGGASSPLKSEDSAASEYVPEHSFWGEDAENSVRIGLAKLAQYADDMHKWAPEKSMEQHYSERLSKLINDGGLKFDTKYLKKD